MRRFELSEGKSNKFWQIALDGASFVVQFGRIGTNGQAQTKSFTSAAAAKAEHDKLVAEKTKKGYREVAAPAGAAAAPRAPAVEPAEAEAAVVEPRATAAADDSAAPRVVMEPAQ